MFKWNYIIVLNIKGKHNCKQFYYIHIVEISTNKGANSYKLRIWKIGNCFSHLDNVICLTSKMEFFEINISIKLKYTDWERL